MTCGDELRKDTIEQLKLAGCAHKLVINETTWADFVFHAFKQERVLANLLQLHQLVTQSLDTSQLYMALTNNNMHPFYFTQVWSIFDDILICCQKHLELTNVQVTLKSFPLSWVTFIQHHLDGGCPFGKLTRPVCHGG